MESTKINTFLDIAEINGVLTLTKFGQPCECPFRNPVILPHPQINGQAVVVQPQCNERCQFFYVVDYSNRQIVDLMCIEPNPEIRPSNPSILQKGLKSGINQPSRPEGGTNGLNLIKP